MKNFSVILFVLALYSPAIECSNNFKNIGESGFGIVSGVVKKIPDVIPSPKELFESGKNLIAGYPFEYV